MIAGGLELILSRFFLKMTSEVVNINNTNNNNISDPGKSNTTPVKKPIINDSTPTCSRRYLDLHAELLIRAPMKDVSSYPQDS